MKFTKKIFNLIIILIIIATILNLFHTSHNINYKVNNKYEVNENYKKENKSNNYYFKVKKYKEEYVFTYNSKNKKRKIIKNIKYYKHNRISCILPIYKNNEIVDLYCLINNKQLSASYLKESNNKDFSKISKELKKDKYKLKTTSYSDKTITKDYISIYQNNIKDYKYVVWFYKGIYIIDNDKIKKERLLKKDKYNNDLSSLVDNYYITINTDLKKNSIEYKEVFIYDLKKYKKETIKVNNDLSINTYINGTYNNSLYITDNDTKKQYKITPKNKKIIKVGDQNKGFKKLSNNKLITIRKNKDNNFDYNIKNKKINKLYGDVIIRKHNSNYYFITKDGKIYQIINNNYKNPVLLLKSVEMNELIFKDDAISYISDNIIYTYTNNYGLRPIIINNEMRYNNKNVYDYMKK